MSVEIASTRNSSVSAQSVSRVGVIVKPNQTDALKTLCELAEWLTARNVTLVGISNQERAQVEAATNCVIETHAPEDLAADVDAVIVLGGDGTMIATARLLGEREIPVLGINYGTLGYLAEFSNQEMHAALEALIAGEYKLDCRMMLDAELYRGAEVMTKSRVLNDVVIGKSALSRIIEIEARCDGQFVNRFRADGLIVSTPTGSTAYNLSAGGPIIYPSMNAVVLTPICPHTLSNRPLVVSGDVEIELVLHTAREEVALTLDGQVGVSIEAGDRVMVRKSRTTFNLMQANSRNYFAVLRDKLSWGK